MNLEIPIHLWRRQAECPVETSQEFLRPREIIAPSKNACRTHPEPQSCEGESFLIER